ncbi:MAG TPA: VanW family protein, partial [Lachnospiraceae bacterium]|nr:VanW family protein [Lachnospiraceae bacterium]
MNIKKWLKKITAAAVMTVLFAGMVHSTAKADEVVNFILNYDTTVYTRQVYSPEIILINDGTESDAIKWITEVCNQVNFITNGEVTIDSAEVKAEVKKEIAAGNQSIKLDLGDYTAQAIAEKKAAAAQALLLSAQSSSDTGMTPEIAANLNALGIDTKISECSTKYTVGQDRSLNIAVAAGRVNGTVLQPGQSFSYDTTILPRTTANGYGPGDIISNGTHIKAIGGGICQVSSTLNNAVLKAGIVPTERHNHSQRVYYLKSGLDATVSS